MRITLTFETPWTLNLPSGKQLAAALMLVIIGVLFSLALLGMITAPAAPAPISHHNEASTMRDSELEQPLKTQLRRDESEVLHAYQDSKGFWTIGVGRLIDQRKGGRISTEESAFLLGNDVDAREVKLEQRLPWFTGLDTARKGVLLNMAFQMGVDGLLAFRNTLAMVQSGDYAGAARGMLDSKWAKEDSPARAFRLAEQMRTGTWM